MGYSPAEIALYWAADHAQPGAAIEVTLTPGEALTVRMLAPHSRRNAKDLRSAALQINQDEDGLTAAPARECHLKVGLRNIGFGASDTAPLTLSLPAEAALVILPASGHLVHTRPESKELTVEVAALQPTAPHRPRSSTAHGKFALT